MKKSVILISALLIAYCLNAQSLFETANSDSALKPKDAGLKFGGYVRGSVFSNVKSYELSTVFAEIALQNSLNYGKAILKSDIRLRKGMFFDEEQFEVQPKELFAGYISERFDLLAGYQIVNYGRTDGFNPTNNITPNNYFFLSANPDDQKEPNLMLRLKYRFTPLIELDVAGIPYYKSSVYRFDLFGLGQNVDFADTQIPERKLKNGAMAARLNFELPAAGWSVSVFDGFDPFHGYDVKSVDWSTGQPVIINAPVPCRKTTLGADLAVPAGSVIMRAEAAYNITKNTDKKMYIPATDLSWVAAAETQLAGFTLICQYIGKFIPVFEAINPPAPPTTADLPSQMQFAAQTIDYENRKMNRLIFQQQEKTNHALSASVMKSFAYDTFDAELTAYYNLTSSDFMLRPNIAWKISDVLHAKAGGVIMKGKDGSLFTYTSEILSGIFAELKVSF